VADAALFFYVAISTKAIIGGGDMKGWYEGYSYAGIMPDGKIRRFATDEEYREAYAEAAAPSSFSQQKQAS